MFERAGFSVVARRQWNAGSLRTWRTDSPRTLAASSAVSPGSGCG